MRTAGRIGRTLSGIMWGLVCLLAAVYLIGVYQIGWRPLPIFEEIGLFRLIISILLICGAVSELLRGRIVGTLIFCIPLVCMYRGILGITMNLATIVVVGALICIAINLIIPRNWRNGWYDYRTDTTRTHDNIEYGRNYNASTENINAGDKRVVDISMNLGASVKHIESNNLRVVNVHNSFGALDIYLDKVQLEEDVLEINISQEFAGTNIYIPYDWQLDNQLHLFAAGVEESSGTSYSNVVSNKKVVLKGRASFAGIRIRRI